ncbi:uncharacterized protein LOC132608132 [Lycium barbarum]|uniref:uncharacterized protein LOC132608132 n=1 Tax=Lycium barbarum TaxID=112863 RepID=UPI00293F5E29|nr:uncharacterized protein LOC132608132 [Lycium barbarum]
MVHTTNDEGLPHFSEVLRLQADMEKSFTYLARVPQEVKDQILAEMHFVVAELSFKYLGVPLSSKKLNIQQRMPLLEKMVARIKCWSTNFPSFSGRLQLIKSILFEMQTHWA